MRDSGSTPWLWLLFMFLSHGVYAQEDAAGNPLLLKQKWPAQWITCPGVSLTDFGVFHFRREFVLEDVPERFIIHVSADNRYRLYVNGTEVSRGPARSDLAHWRFESPDIAQYLRKGENVLAAVVWNYGEYKPLAQVSLRTAFIVQGDGDHEAIVNTDKKWKVLHDTAYTPRPALQTSVGPGIEVEGKQYPYGWQMPDYPDDGWEIPRVLGNGIPRGAFTFWDWALVPRKIPVSEYRLQRLRQVERSVNCRVDSRFPEGTSPVTVGPHQKAKILLDQTFLTTAYPEIVVSGGRGAVIELRYAEAMVDKNGVKGNREVTEEKTPLALYSDIFRPDGGQNRRFQPLWFRTYRYLEVVIETQNDPLTIQDLYGYFTAYPFQEKASFNSDDASLRSIWQVGWRTARLCAGETYYDCPYYEQLQYVGDTRIQALISLYVAGDDRLVRKAIDQFHNSLLPEGLTLCAYPSCQMAVIPPFSLFWIGMVHDYWMLRDDKRFVGAYLNGIRNVLEWFDERVDTTGMLGPLEWWNFVDWSFGPWNSQRPTGGTPPGAMEGHSSILTLQYILALQQAADLFDGFGQSRQAASCRRRAEYLWENVYAQCWDEKKGMLADTPGHSSFSQHANILAILSGRLYPAESDALYHKIITDKTLTQATFYFKYYLVEAMWKVGEADDYVRMLDPWRDMLREGLTTFAETPAPTRSDCHAWSASPDYHLLSVVAGIRPAGPGFKKVVIEPHLGPLKHIEARMPHYMGDIVVSLKRKKRDALEGEISLPEGLTGAFVWKNKTVALKSGKNKIKM